MRLTPFNKEPASLTFDPSVFMADVALLSSLTKDQLLISVNKKSAYLVAISTSGQIAARKLKLTEQSGTGSFQINKDVLGTALKARKSDVQMTYDGKKIVVNVVRGKFSAELNTTPVVPERIEAINQQIGDALRDGAGTEMDQAVQDEMWAAIDLAAIHDVIFGMELPRLIELKKGLLQVTSYDNLHMSRVKTKLKAPDFRLALNDEYVAHLRKLMGSSVGLKLAMTNNCFLATSEEGLLYLPPRTVQDSEWEKVATMMDNAEFKPKIRLETQPGRMNTVLENLTAVYEQGASVKCTVTDKGLAMEMTSSHGTVKDTMPCESVKGKGSFSIESNILMNLLGLLPPGDKVVIELQPGACYRITSETAGVEYLGSMHED